MSFLSEHGLEITAAYQAAYIQLPENLQEPACQVPAETGIFTPPLLDPPVIPLVCATVFPPIFALPYAAVECPSGTTITSNILTVVSKDTNGVITPGSESTIALTGGPCGFSLDGTLTIITPPPGVAGGTSGVIPGVSSYTINASCGTADTTPLTIGVAYSAPNYSVFLQGDLPLTCFGCDGSNSTYKVVDMSLNSLKVTEIQQTDCCGVGTGSHINICSGLLDFFDSFGAENQIQLDATFPSSIFRHGPTGHNILINTIGGEPRVFLEATDSIDISLVGGGAAHIDMIGHLGTETNWLATGPSFKLKNVNEDFILLDGAVPKIDIETEAGNTIVANAVNPKIEIDTPSGDTILIDGSVPKMDIIKNSGEYVKISADTTDIQIADASSDFATMEAATDKQGFSANGGGFSVKLQSSQGANGALLEIQGSGQFFKADGGRLTGNDGVLAYDLVEITVCEAGVQKKMKVYGSTRY